MEKIDQAALEAIAAQNPGYKVSIGPRGEIDMTPLARTTEEMKAIAATERKARIQAAAPAIAQGVEVLSVLESEESAA